MPEGGVRTPDSAVPSAATANTVSTDLPAATSAAVADSGGADNVQVVHLKSAATLTAPPAEGIVPRQAGGVIVGFQVFGVKARLIKYYPRGPNCVMDSAIRFPVGTSIGDYELLACLGVGGMATVYLARHCEQENRVALKILERAAIEHAGGLALIQREIETASSLVHPNIVRTFTSGTHDGLPFVVMQFFEGGTLFSPENAVRYAPPDRAIELMIKVAR